MLPIRRVVVHPDGAVVHREGFTQVSDGHVELTGLPFLLDPASVRVSAVGVGEVEVELDPSSLLGFERPAALEELEAATLAVRRVEAELAGLRAERAVVAGLVPSFSSEPDGPRPTAGSLAGWARADEVVEEHLAALDAQLLLREEAHRQAVEAQAMAAARADAENAEPLWRRMRPTRRVRARVRSEGTVAVAVSYVVPGASWSPSYGLDADLGLTRGTFSLRALVVQATGEDWTGVTLALSTAPVGRRVDLPALRALRLSRRQERPPVAFRELPVDLDTLFPTLPPPGPSSVALAPAEGSESLFDDADDGASELEAAILMAPAAVQRKSAGGPIATALGAVFGGGGAPAAPRAAPSRARRLPEPVQNDAPDELVVDELDYGAYELAAADRGEGRRGRLVPRSELDRVRERSPAVAARLGEAVDELTRSCERALRPEWPPHHVLAGPIQGNDRQFVVQGAVGVPADGHLHSLSVATWPATLSVSYRTVPRHDPRVYRLVDVRLDGAQGSLLAGPVDVLVGGRLEVTTPWAGSAGRGQLRMGLGAEDRLRVVRNVRYKDESAGLFGGSRRVSTQVEVSVASGMPTPVRMEVLERVPVPADKETLTVEITEASPIAEGWKGEVDGPLLRGVRVQRLEVPPGGEARAVLTSVVTLGAKDELVGGDHRG